MSTYAVHTEPVLEDLASGAMIRLGLQLLNPFGPEDAASPGPADEIAGAVLIIGGLAWKYSDELGEYLMENHPLPYGGVTSYPYQSHPVTSTTGHSERNTAKKQIRSTSHSRSRRRYYYGKKRKYYT